MKIEVEYTIQEVTKYKIVRSYTSEGTLTAWATGFDGSHRGEFETRAAAEDVKTALEADLGRKMASIV